MKAKIISLACMLSLVSLAAEACDYVDDPRLSSSQMPGLVQAMAAGETVPPVKIRVGTYLMLGERSRSLLEPHLVMFDVNCSPVGGFEGKLLTNAVIPFEEFYRVMAQAIHDDRPDRAKQLFQQVSVSPITHKEMQKLFGQLPYPGTHGLPVFERMQKIFPQFKKILPLDEELIDPSTDGRAKDYVMLKLFRVFGGELLIDQGCKKLELDKRFYKVIRVKSLFMGEHDEYLIRKEPINHMLRAMGFQKALQVHGNSEYGTGIHQAFYDIYKCEI